MVALFRVLVAIGRDNIRLEPVRLARSQNHVHRCWVVILESQHENTEHVAPTAACAGGTPPTG